MANVSAFYYGTSPNKFIDYIAVGLSVLTIIQSGQQAAFRLGNMIQPGKVVLVAYKKGRFAAFIGLNELV
ncbi:MAG: hypothetical protein GX087_10530 [Desulfobulbaceae bacterium]|nr:hypothetical protein [Desulfobulbaceae bacterium]